MNKTRLPDQHQILFDPQTDTICGHLGPVLAYLRSRSVNIVSREQMENGWLVIRLDDFFYKGEIDSRFERPPFLEWVYADPALWRGERFGPAPSAVSPWRRVLTYPILRERWV